MKALLELAAIVSSPKRVRLGAVASVLMVAAGAAAYGGVAIATDREGGAQRMPSTVPTSTVGYKADAFLPTGIGSEYDRAVARMIWVNHRLEERQALLSSATRAGLYTPVIDALREEVTSLERRYASAIRAMTTANRAARRPRTGR